MPSITTEVSNFFLNLIRQSGYFGVFGLMVLIMMLPIPSEIILPFIGYYLVYSNHFNFWVVVGVTVLGSLFGTMVDYTIGYRFGREAFIRFGHLIRVNAGHLHVVENWFIKYGSITVLLIRFIPFVRTLIAFPAGIAKMNIPKFVAYSTVGIFIWNAVLIYAGIVAGQNYLAITNTIDVYLVPISIVSVILVIGIVGIFIWYRSCGHRWY